MTAGRGVLGLRPGLEVWLMPRTLGAAGACYRTDPRAIVTGIAGDQITVRLADGAEVTTHRDNVATRPPARLERRTPAPRRAAPGPFGDDPMLF